MLQNRLFSALASRSGFGAAIADAVARSSIVVCNSVSADRIVIAAWMLLGAVQYYCLLQLDLVHRIGVYWSGCIQAAIVIVICQQIFEILALLIFLLKIFFPRASERRVLPIVGVCKTSSHLHTFSHTFSSSHLLIFTPSHLHIFSSSHLLIFTSSHLHILSSSHLLIFTSSHLHILSSSHLLIFTSSHLHIFSSSHLHIFSSSHLLIFTSSHPPIFSSSSHLHIFSHLLILTSSHLTPSPLALLPSCPLLLFYFFLEGGSRGSGNETARNATLSHEMMFDRQKLR